MKHREKYTPEVGKEYRLPYGGVFRCIGKRFDGTPVMQNVRSGWTIDVHGCGIYEDGTIDWDYSTGGYFAG